MTIRTKRIYDAPAPDDGFRILVDRLWPRGIKREAAQVDFWAKELAPSTTLRKWFGHEKSKFSEFRTRYLRELEEKHDLVREVVEKAGPQPITLLFAARDRSCNHAAVLQEFLSDE